MNKRRIARFTMFFFMTASLSLYAAGKSQSGGNTPSDGNAGSKVIIWWHTSLSSTLEYEEGIVKALPQYDIELNRYQADDFATQLRIAFSSGIGPDVSYTNAGASLHGFIDNNYVLDITGEYFRRGWNKRTYPEFEAGNSKNGRVYGISISALHPWQTVYYNKAKLDEFGIKIPARLTIDEFLPIAAAVKAKGMQPIAFGIKDPWVVCELFGDYMFQVSDPSIVDKLNSGEVHWDTSPEVKAALTAMIKMAKGGAFVSGWEAQDQGFAINSFLGGICAMLYNGTWFSEFIDGGIRNCPIEMGSFILPLIDKNTTIKGTQLWSDWVVFINAKTKNRAASYDVMDYLSSDGYAAAISKDIGVYSGNPEVNKTIKLPPVFQAEPLTSQLDLPKSMYFDFAFPTPVVTVMKVELSKALTAAETVEQCLKNIEAAHARER
ncbi:MAG: extracellular solute-binding protein [Treponema sp.]|nr:extracellular solute-binding protein [Treponema sp.]